MKITQKSWFPHALAVVFFLVITSVYFLPVFEGFVLKQGDILQYKGVSQELRDYYEETGEDAYWFESLFSGMPSYSVFVMKSNNIFTYLLKIQKVFPRPPFYFFMMMVSFYILLLTFKTRPLSAVIGAIAYAFSTFFIISTEAGHNTKVHAIAYIPMIVAGVVWVFTRKKWLVGLLLFATGLSLQLTANHYQITYYTAMICAVLCIYYIVVGIKGDKKVFVKQLLTLGAGAVLALSLSSKNLLTTQEFSKSTIRGKRELTIGPDGNPISLNKNGLDTDYMTNWSLGVGETWQFVIPNAKGSDSRPLSQEEGVLDNVPQRFKPFVGQFSAYWGNQPFVAGPVYIGALMCLLFILALVFVKNKIKWPLLVIFVWALFMAWGKNMLWFTEFMIDFFPMYTKFRTVTMSLVMAITVIPLLAVLFIEEVLNSENFFTENKKKIYISGGVFIGLIALFTLTPGSFFDFQSEQELAMIGQQINQNPSQSAQFSEALTYVIDAREGMFSADGFRSLFFMIAGVLALALASFKKLKPQTALIIISVFTLIDLWGVDKRFLNNEKVRGKYIAYDKVVDGGKFFPVAPYDVQVLNRELSLHPEIQTLIEQKLAAKRAEGRMNQHEVDRIKFNTLRRNTHYRVFDLTANPFTSARASYYHKSLGGYHAAKLRRYQDVIEFYLSKQGNAEWQQVINQLNTKYLFVPNQQGGMAQENPMKFGAAWLANSVNKAKDSDEAILHLGKPGSEKQVLIQGETGAGNYSGNGSVSLTSYLPNRLTYDFSSTENQYVVFSEVFYQPGWDAFVDGVKVSHDCVNYLLRGMEVSAGTHTIEFVFEPSSVSITDIITLIGSILWLGLFGAAIYLNVKK